MLFSDIKLNNLQSDFIEELEDDLQVKAVAQEIVDETDYKLFTIILIVMLWVLFIIILVVFRLNQNKKTMS